MPAHKYTVCPLAEVLSPQLLGGSICHDAHNRVPDCVSFTPADLRCGQEMRE